LGAGNGPQGRVLYLGRFNLCKMALFLMHRVLPSFLSFFLSFFVSFLTFFLFSFLFLSLFF
jgi:hypothetical protein